MTPVMQTRFEKGHGNCLNACVASILDLPIGGSGVPEGRDDLRPWLLAQDMGIMWITLQPGTVTLPGAGSYYLGAGQSPRDPDVAHAIVMSEYREVHDPHPSGRFLEGHVQQIGFVVRMGRP